MYGIQTFNVTTKCATVFENDVNMYGIQTDAAYYENDQCLRMM